MQSVLMKLEVVVIPVSDVDRAKSFYESIGWRLDANFAKEDGFRVVQFTPPGSPCSIHFGSARTGIGAAAPGSAQGLYLVVSDIEAAHAELIGRGVDVDGIFHGQGRATFFAGLDPARGSYNSLFSFRDPDGNGWLVQEITRRLPGRVEPGASTFTSVVELAAALQRAATAHAQHEQRTGKADKDWPKWYADYIVREQAGEDPPV